MGDGVNWSDGNNWNPNAHQEPQRLEITATVDTAGAVAYNAAAGGTVDSLTVNTNNAILTPGRALTVSVGLIVGSAGATPAGSTLETANTLTVSGTSQSTRGGRSIRPQGVLSVTGAATNAGTITGAVPGA